MKKTLVLLTLLLSASVVFAQKSGYIYSKKVFDVIPAYNSAIKEIEQFATDSRDEIDKKLDEVATLYEQYQLAENRMTVTQAENYRAIIIAKEKEANDLEEKVFGQNGQLEQKQKTLMEPIEKQVMDAVEAVSREQGYNMVFDLSLVKMTIYQSPDSDLTNAVIRRLGY